jgi:DNA-binding MarR family transcriptional regulator
MMIGSAAHLGHGPLENVFRCIQVYRRHVNAPSLQVFEAFLLVASTSPIVLTEMARLLDTSQSQVTFALSHLGDGGPKFPKQYGKPPGLVGRVDHPVDARYRLAALTPKGNQLVAEMRSALGLLR